MIANLTATDFSKLLTDGHVYSLMSELELIHHDLCLPSTLNQMCIVNLAAIKTLNAPEKQSVDALITLFNSLFASQNVVLMHSEGEPEYFAATRDNPARITFAHGFIASALHEISHWCIAGRQRRGIDDFGYWYAADGRSQAQQRSFEHVEVKPQALECLFTLACDRPFQVSQDNLFADFDTSNSTFALDVYTQVSNYISMPTTLPCDARVLLRALLTF